MVSAFLSNGASLLLPNTNEMFTLSFFMSLMYATALYAWFDESANYIQRFNIEKDLKYQVDQKLYTID